MTTIIVSGLFFSLSGALWSQVFNDNRHAWDRVFIAGNAVVFYVLPVLFLSGVVCR